MFSPPLLVWMARRCPRWQRLALAWAAVSLGATVGAQTPAATPLPADLGQITQRWIDQTLRSNNPSSTLRMEVSVGQLDERLRLAPCERIEPYLPTGSKLWGRTRLGLRCLSGPTRWNVFLPLTVKAYGMAWVLKGNVNQGAVLSENDAIQAEVDWAADVSPVVADKAQWVGQIAAYSLQGGQVLRQSVLRPAHLFQAGAQVRVVVKGPGYAVTSIGQAMGPGGAGQTVRIKMESGKVISGVVSPTGVVEIQ